VKKVIVNIARFILAAVLILSGFVKAVDPLGTQYKISDYLGALQLEAYVPDTLALGVSILLSAFEFILGTLLLLAIRRRTVSVLTLLLLGVMTPITLWLAVANPVSDCGCFGDAIVLTNWQTFGKNVVLLALALVIWHWPLLMVRFISRGTQWIVINYTAVFILTVSGWSLYDLPYFDFRPYHIGANIKQGMEFPDDAEQPQFETTFILEKDGERREFTTDNYPDSTWTFIDAKTVQVSEGYVPPIHDFSITRVDTEADITDSLLTLPGYVFLLVAPRLENADDSQLDLINEVHAYAQEYNYPFCCLTASGEKGINNWSEQTGAEYPFCHTDETTLKTVIRSNPGLLLLKDGTIIRKWSHNRLPDEYTLNAPLEKLETGQMPEDSVPGKILVIVLWYVLPLLVLTLLDRLWNFKSFFKHTKQNNYEKENRSRQLEDEPEPARGHCPGQGTE